MTDSKKRYVVLTPRGNQWRDNYGKGAMVGSVNICNPCLPLVTADLKPGWSMKEIAQNNPGVVCFHCQDKTPGRFCEDE